MGLELVNVRSELLEQLAVFEDLFDVLAELPEFVLGQRNRRRGGGPCAGARRTLADVGVLGPAEISRFEIRGLLVRLPGTVTTDTFLYHRPFPPREWPESPRHTCLSSS